MIVLKYSLIKYLKSPLIWFVIIIGFFATFIMIAFIYFPTINYQTINALEYQLKTRLLYLLGLSISAFIAILFSIIIGVRMIKDEEESGTFLIVISKPQKRSTIIFQKWLAMIVLILFYVFILALAMIFAVLLKDHPNANLRKFSAKSHLYVAIPIFMMLLFILMLLFASIGTILAMRLSSLVSLMIGIIFVIYLPLSSLIKTFDNSSKRIDIVSDWSGWKLIRKEAKFFNKNQHLVKSFLSKLGSKGPKIILENSRMTANISQIYFPDFLIKSLKKINFTSIGQKIIAKEIKFDIDLYSDKKFGIFKLYFKKTSNDSYRYLSYLDLSYQVEQLATLGEKWDKSVDKYSLKDADINAFLSSSNRATNKRVIDQKSASNKYVDQFIKINEAKIMEWNKTWKAVLKKSFKIQLANMPEITPLILQKSDEIIDSLIKRPNSVLKKVFEHQFYMYVSLDRITHKMSNRNMNISMNILNVNKEATDLRSQYIKKRKPWTKKEYNHFWNGKSEEALHELSTDNVLMVSKVDDYINKKAILFAYIIFILAMMPLSYLLLRWKDFR